MKLKEIQRREVWAEVEGSMAMKLKENFQDYPEQYRYPTLDSIEKDGTYQVYIRFFEYDGVCSMVRKRDRQPN